MLIALALGGLNVLLTVLVGAAAINGTNWTTADQVMNLAFTAIFAFGIWIAAAIWRDRPWARVAGEGLGFLFLTGGIIIAVSYCRVILGQEPSVDPIRPACAVLLCLGTWMSVYFSRINRESDPQK